MFTRFKVELCLARTMLGTNPMDPNILDKHIIDKARQLIAKESRLDREINKYQDAVGITDKRKEAEAERLIKRLEHRLGKPLEKGELEALAEGKLDLFRETFAELADKGTTVFFWDDKANLPCIGDHMIYGFMKAAIEAIGKCCEKRAQGKPFQSISWTQALVNQHVRCEEEFITFDRDIIRDSDGEPEYCQRSLRAKTAQGDRIALAKSEQIPSGAKLNFTLKVMTGSPLLAPVDLAMKDHATGASWKLQEKNGLIAIFNYGELSGLGQWRNSGRGQFKHEMEAA